MNTADPAESSGSLGSAFSFVAIPELHQIVAQVLQEDSLCPSFLTIPSGEAILDIGATQDLIGAEAAKGLKKRLECCGLQALEVDVPPMIPTGIGGPAKVLQTLLVPISPGRSPGIITMTVFKADIPPLLSVGLLEHLKAQIDLKNNIIHFEELDVQMRMGKLPSGNRTIPIVQWAGDEHKRCGKNMDCPMETLTCPSGPLRRT